LAVQHTQRIRTVALQYGRIDRVTAMAKATGDDWILQWIAQQREQLARIQTQVPSGDDLSAQMRDLGIRWLDVGQSYLQGWMQFARHSAAIAGASESSSKVAEEVFSTLQGTWAGAASASEGAARQFADLLARAPALGLAREHAETWRDLMAAQAESQQLGQELRTVLAKVQSDALGLVERHVREKPVSSHSELYDLWVECGEQVFAQVAHSDAYCKLQAQLGNATAKLRLHQQAIIERALRQYDLPTRSELNTVHRQMKELRERVAELEARLNQTAPNNPNTARREQ
jgi:polyhydroxyalkanoate synthesis regulator phasin